MDTVPLTAQARSTDTTSRKLRRSDQVPCVVYGNHTENIALQCVYNELYGAYEKAGESTIVDLAVGEKKVPVLFHAVEFDPVSDKITHVDFYAVDMKKEIEAQVPIRLEGEAPAVKELGGVLVTVLNTVTVMCLPTNLPHELMVSIETLEAFGDSLPVGAVSVPEGVSIKEDPETVIATIQEPRKEVEEVKPEEEEVAEGEVAEGEAPVEGEEKKDEGEGKKEEGKGEGK